VVAALAAGPSWAGAAWHDEHPGAGVPVHYVRLTGHGGDNDANRRNQQAMYDSCAKARIAAGQPVPPLPAGGIPALISNQDIEIYYAANRTLSVSRAQLSTVDPVSCELKTSANLTLRLTSSVGRCDIDLVRKQARGVCDASAHEHAAIALPRRAAADQPAGEKTVLGMSCDVHRAAAVSTEICVAEPTPASDHPLDPFPIPADPFNAGHPGLLLQVDSPALTLRARDVRLNLSVSHDVFALPPGLDVKSIPPRPRT
jgi:hypothetical protein